MRTYKDLKTKLLVITIFNIVIIFYTVYQIKRFNQSEIKSLYLIGSERVSADNVNYTYKQVNFALSEVYKNFGYVLQPNQCQAEANNFLAIILIKSATINTVKRMSHRRAMSQEELTNMGLRRIFLLGEVSPTMNNINQTILKLEHDTYGDLIQGNFQDTYKNLSYKSWMGLHWASSECKNAKFIIKMDDDFIYDIYNITNYLKNFLQKSSKLATSNELLLGHKILFLEPIRNPRSKHYVTRNEYATDYYPQYVAGWFYITNPLTAGRLVEEAIQTPLFWIDDVWITGIVRERLQIPIKSIYSWFSHNNADLQCCIKDVQQFHYFCDYKVGLINEDPNFLHTFQNTMKICSEGNCKQKPLKHSLLNICNDQFF